MFEDELALTEIEYRDSVIIPGTGHTPGKTVKENETAASCGNDGEYDEVSCCTVCGKEISRTHVVIPKLTEHSGITHIAAKEATETEEGNTEYWYCTECGKYYADIELTDEIPLDDTVIPKLSTRLLGDVDGNGRVEVNDLTLLQKYLAGWNVNIVRENTDIDGTEGITIGDLTALQKSLAGWNVTLK